ncbi:hypothetical protein FQA39_LY19358 [Lamprigera yunnana]|nr:hypothetical protein FQA39_LY16617 [Lamprigera yunnana]KAF5294107.1 hypothetical protein FQA39_LY19358 [Lamprigera yunnana]
MVNCGSRADRDLVKFYAKPKVLNYTHLKHKNELSKLRREKWLSAIKRDDLTNSKINYQRDLGMEIVENDEYSRDEDSSIYIQTVISGKDMIQQEEDVIFMNQQLHPLKLQLKKYQLHLKADDKKCKYYTGLSSPL